MKWIGLAGFAVMVVSYLLPAQPQATSPSPATAIRAIQITSERKNLGGSWRKARPRLAQTGQPKTSIDVVKNGEAYYEGGEAVNPALVAALAEALRAAVNPEPNRDDLGFTPAWLKANAPRLGEKLTSSTLVGGKPIHEADFELAFADPATVANAIPLLFRHQFCVDCDHFIESVEISASFEDGTQIRARAGSDFPYMLPWHMQDNGADVVAYNADISRAVAALLPEDAANHSLLGGEHLDMRLGRIVLSESEHNVRLLEVEEKTGETLKTIRSRYAVESAEIGPYEDPALVGRTAEQSNLVLRLKSADWPSNVSEAVMLKYEDGNVVGTDNFLQDAPGFEKLVLSIPWLKEYAKNHARVPIQISFVRDASLSHEALALFSADMKLIGREELIPKVQAVKRSIAFVTIGSGMSRSDWLAFPDGRMLLWRFWRIGLPSAPSSLPVWPDSEYSAKPCAASSNNLLHCVGREVSLNGSLQPLSEATK